MFETYESVGPLRAEWDDLAERTGSSPFARPGWFEAWYRAFARGRPLVAALRRDRRAVAVAALESRGKTLCSAANWHTPVYEVVAEDPEAARALAAAVVGRRPRRLELRFLDDDGLTLSAFGAAAAAADYRLLRRPLQESPYVPVDGDWESYAATLGRNQLKELARRWRGLERAGGTVAVTFEDGGNLDDALEEGFRLEASGWKGRSGTAIVSRPETRRFYSEVARWAAEHGWLRLTYLSVGGAPIAFQFDLEANGVVYHLKPGYDESYGRFRPGKLLTRHVLEDAFERGLRSYEFLGDRDAHKLEWTQSVRERLVMQAFAPSPAGWAELAAFRFGRPAALRTLAAARHARRRLPGRGGR